MEPNVVKTDLDQVRALRVLFLQESNMQFVHDKCHLYGWADTYMFLLDDLKIGYGAVWGQSKREDRDAIFEFYITKPYRKFANIFFSKLLLTPGVIFIECQSNDLLLSSMFYEYAKSIQAEAILFEDLVQTGFAIPGVVFQKKPVAGTGHDANQYILIRDDKEVATGGLMLNYNMPYADLYYEVNENERQKGYGSLMVQELKKEAYLMGRVPAARCNINNLVSKATLLKAGLGICGHLLKGKINKRRVI